MITLKQGAITAEFNKKGAAIDKLYYGKRLVATKGVTVGRYANRIAKGRFVLDGNMYQLSQNEGINTLHGGKDRFQDRTWKAELLDDFGMITNDESDASAVKFSLLSPDGDQGFPGNLSINVTYTIADGNKIVIEYEARCDKDCFVNFTNHAYFNLNGGGSIREHDLWVDTYGFTEVDDELIPSGKIVPTEGTKYDLIQGGRYKNDLDYNFILNGDGFRRVAVLKGLESRLNMSCFTDQPGLQIYNTETEVCLETQHYPDSPNHPEFPSTLLKKGEVFKSRTIYEFSK